MRSTTDFLVIGSGIAGLSFALKVADFGTVTVITKTSPEESNTKYAQGGIAGVLDDSDSLESHIADTIAAGAGRCDERIVRLVVSEAPERIREVMSWGARFDRKADGTFDLAKEGGHSTHRVLHYKDSTGNELERALLDAVKAHPRIVIHDHYFAVDLLTQHHLGDEVNRSTPGITCYGAYLLNTRSQQVETVLARCTLVATGGLGQVYRSTTNPIIATGDGVAMVYRAKGQVKDMEFVQFHPTALYRPGESPAFLISEAVRGFGAKLVTKRGESFLHRYDTREELAPRDIVARAIDHELKSSGDEYVGLDCRHLDETEFMAHFPGIHQKCLSLGIDPKRQFIPVVPSAHYSCGGVVVDDEGRTSIERLYAAGECACTGLHGANRLASNSLLEALVFAHRAAQSAVAVFSACPFEYAVPEWNAEGTVQPNEWVLITHNRKELQHVMSDYVGIVRSDLRLKRAIDRLRILYGETEALYERTVVSPGLCELRNMIAVSYLIVKAAMARKESVGLHYSTDYPAADGHQAAR